MFGFCYLGENIHCRLLSRAFFLERLASTKRLFAIHASYPYKPPLIECVQFISNKDYWFDWLINI